MIKLKPPVFSNSEILFGLFNEKQWETLLNQQGSQVDCTNNF
jgi:hypothetical protein